MAASSELRWYGNGPGYGRDARIAYSSLLGRYFARAYLTMYEGVRALIPLDVARQRFRGTPYVIQKDPPSRGLEADWIGLDRYGLVIAEAKGSFSEGFRPWHGPTSWPAILRTALEQAERTVVFKRSTWQKLPAKRWAIASRWGTEANHCEPTLLTWRRYEAVLRAEDYLALERILLRADRDSVLTGLGHQQVLETLRHATRSERLPTEFRLRVGNHDLEPGFTAMVGSFGVYPLQAGNRRNLVSRIRRIRDIGAKLAVASLSGQYARTVGRARLQADEETPSDRVHAADFVALDEGSADNRDAVEDHYANQAGLTVVWPKAGEDIVLERV